jgi:hypothetical protein
MSYGNPTFTATHLRGNSPCFPISVFFYHNAQPGIRQEAHGAHGQKVWYAVLQKDKSAVSANPFGELRRT